MRPTWYRADTAKVILHVSPDCRKGYHRIDSKRLEYRRISDPTQFKDLGRFQIANEKRQFTLPVYCAYY